MSPKVLRRAEPLSALDPEVRLTLRGKSRRIQTETGITTVFVAHDQEEALAISDRVCVMSQGRIEQLGTPTEVYRSPSTAFVARFVGSMNEFDVEVAGVGEVNVLGMRVGVPSSRPYSVGARLVLLVRPEGLCLGDDGLAGSVTSVTFQGATTTVGARLDVLDSLVSISVGQGAADHLTIGDRITVGINGANAMCEAV